MSKFKYVTPYWRDSQTVFGEGIKTYTGTTFYIVNLKSFNNTVKLYFYDFKGNLIPEMSIEMIISGNAVLDLRLVDIISFKDPSYRLTSNLKTGSVRLYSDEPVVANGKMFNGKSTSKGGTEDLNIWSIDFKEVEFIPLKYGVAEPNPIPDKNFGEYMKKKYPFPK